MKLEVDGIDYLVKPLTIETYEFFTENENIDDITLVSKFTDCNPELLKRAKFTDIKFVSNMIRGSFGQMNDKSKLEMNFEVDGVRYGLLKPSELTYEEWVNLEVFMSKTPIDLGLISTHLYKPLKNDKLGEERELIDYDLEECRSRVELFRTQVPLSIFLSAFFFIAIFVQKLTEGLLDSTENKMNQKKMMEKQRKKPTIIHQKKSSNP